MLSLAWGTKVGPFFRHAVRNIAFSLGIPDASWLMACMAFETAETFSPSIRNAAGSGAVGLIQFMPATALDLGTTVEDLARMRQDDQLHYVWKYFYPYRNRLMSVSDVYMAILWPAAIGKSEDYVIWEASLKPYRQNAMLDFNQDRQITKAEAAKFIAAKLAKGLSSALAA